MSKDYRCLFVDKLHDQKNLYAGAGTRVQYWNIKPFDKLHAVIEAMQKKLDEQQEAIEHLTKLIHHPEHVAQRLYGSAQTTAASTTAPAYLHEQLKADIEEERRWKSTPHV